MKRASGLFACFWAWTNLLLPFLQNLSTLLGRRGYTYVAKISRLLLTAESKAKLYAAVLCTFIERTRGFDGTGGPRLVSMYLMGQAGMAFMVSLLLHLYVFYLTRYFGGRFVPLKELSLHLFPSPAYLILFLQAASMG